MKPRSTYLNSRAPVDSIVPEPTLSSRLSSERALSSPEVVQTTSHQGDHQNNPELTSELGTQRTTRILHPENYSSSETQPSNSGASLKAKLASWLRTTFHRRQQRKPIPNVQRALLECESEIIRSWVYVWIGLGFTVDLWATIKMANASQLEQVMTLAIFAMNLLLLFSNQCLTVRVSLVVICFRVYLGLLKMQVYVDNLNIVINSVESITLLIRVLGMELLIICHVLNLSFIVKLIQTRRAKELCIIASFFPIFVFVLQFVRKLMGLGFKGELQLLVQLIILTAMLVGMIFAFLRVHQKILSFHYALIQKQKKETSQYVRMVDSIKEAMMVFQDSKATFKNKAANALLADLPDEDLLSAPIFFVFKDGRSEEQQVQELPALSRRSSQAFMSTYSLSDILDGKVEDLQSTVFTLNQMLVHEREVNQVHGILEQLENTEGGGLQGSFSFFLIKVFSLQNQDSSNEQEERVVQLIDISEKILADGLNSERKYMAYMNSTVSHEMRNPLNSISSQLRLLQSLFADTEEISSDMEVTKASKFKKLIVQCQSSMKTCLSSCRLLTFTVEDILALPQLKEGRFTKNIQEVNLASSIQEIMSIVELQARDKKVQLELELHGFSLFEDQHQRETTAYTLMDEKRFQQVLLNYVSNALKFTNKKKGRIRILLQKIDSESYLSGVRFLEQEVLAFYGFDMMTTSVQNENLESGSLISPINIQDEAYGLLAPDLEPKFILTVLDNGIGIKEADKTKLFKLFGCLKATRSMNTQGIGLGLVITKMITQEFGGDTRVFSKYGAGAIFQSSFSIQVPDEELPSPTMRRMSSGYSDIESATFSYKQKLRFTSKVQAKKCADNYSAILNEERAFCYSTKKILIIDDEPFNCKALESIFQVLRLRNCEEVVDIAFSGQEALGLVQNSISKSDPSSPSCEYAVIFTDCSMPFMDGYECTRRITQLLDVHQIPSSERPSVIAVTGHVEPEFQKKAVACGMSHVYSKPISVDNVSKVLLEFGFSFRIPESLNNFQR